MERQTGLHAAGPRLNSQFPSSPCLNFVISFSGWWSRLGRCSENAKAFDLAPFRDGEWGRIGRLKWPSRTQASRFLCAKSLPDGYHPLVFLICKSFKSVLGSGIFTLSTALPGQRPSVFLPLSGSCPHCYRGLLPMVPTISSEAASSPQLSCRWTRKMYPIRYRGGAIQPRLYAHLCSQHLFLPGPCFLVC
jgi:hypothetical protein